MHTPSLDRKWIHTKGLVKRHHFKIRQIRDRKISLIRLQKLGAQPKYKYEKQNNAAVKVTFRILIPVHTTDPPKLKSFSGQMQLIT
jgi:hypothetical protein